MELLTRAVASPIAFLVLAMLILLVTGLGALLLFRPRAARPPTSEVQAEGKDLRRAA